MTSSIQNKISILTHRGLDPDIENFYVESSFEAFTDQLGRGYGLEFDINFSRDDKIFIFHDRDLERITRGVDRRKFENMELEEILKIRINGNRLCSLDELLGMISRKTERISALHLKSRFQEKKYLNILAEHLERNSDLNEKMIIFDIKLETARYLKERIAEIMLAPSVAHPYDIKRFNGSTGGTLYTIDEIVTNKELFDWVWLDEWDLVDEEGKTKTLYNEENFNILKHEGFRIALVTPELHGTSPGLLGGETHPDAASNEQLEKRVKEIIRLKPDAICTDHPAMIYKHCT